MNIRPNQVNKACKRGPIGPRQLIQGTKCSPRQSTKCSVREAVYHSGQWAPRPGHCDHQGVWWLPRPISSGRFDFFVAFRFPRNFSYVWAVISPLKGMNLAIKKWGFNNFSNSLTHPNEIGEIGRKEKRIKWKQRRSGKIEGSSLRLLNKLFRILFTFYFLLLDLV